jgi:hypothetical protein
LGISAILKKGNKQKQMVYMGYVDNISAFDSWRNMLDWQRYIGDFVKVDFFDKNPFYRFAPPS